MGHSLDWFNRVFEALHDEETYEAADYDLFEFLGESCIFKKNIGEKHPTIELYDFEGDERIVHVNFDPANGCFYLPVYDEKVSKEMHVLLESYEDILTVFIGAWKKHLNGYLSDEEEMDEEDGSENYLFDDATQHLYNCLQYRPFLCSFQGAGIFLCYSPGTQKYEWVVEYLE